MDKIYDCLGNKIPRMSYVAISHPRSFFEINYIQKQSLDI